MKFCIGGAALCLALFAAMEPSLAAEAARGALVLCGGTLAPSLFPFFVCANVMLASGMIQKAGEVLKKPAKHLFGIGRGGAAAIPLGFISGYPSGAIVAARLYEGGSISKKEAEALLAFTNNPGPMFVIGVIGEGLYKSQRTGILLFLSVVLASIVAGICMRQKGGGKTALYRRQTHPGDPMGQAISAILRLSGFVVLFAVISAFLRWAGILEMVERLLQRTGLGEKTAKMLTAGVLEVSALAEYGGALPSMAGLLSFGGFSVFLQVWDTARKAGLSVKRYLAGKILSAGLAAFFCRILLAVFPISVSTANWQGKTVVFGTYLGTATLLSFGAYALFRKLSMREKSIINYSCKKRQ